VAFGKKTQVCGIYAGHRVDEVPENVFRKSSRINSTFGGNLVDMVRCRRFIEIIEAEGLEPRVREVGKKTIAGLREIARESGAFSNVRGTGTLIAFTLDTPEARRALLDSMFDNGLMALPSGIKSIRFRLPLTFALDEVDTLLKYVAQSIPAAAKA
ncbi:MAG: aminotransferase class III-fold pyridoxal phosphate-dependent enzyme, partial [Phycisphaerales bacterium]|nr:aminotransferase class III-fold pyridoxal phosphate-dependent enzyme [Phycisphaerales bacterium]